MIHYRLANFFHNSSFQGKVGMIHYRLANFFHNSSFQPYNSSFQGKVGMIHYRLANFFSTLQFIVSGKSWNDTLQAGKFFFNLTIHRFREKLE